MIAKTNQHSAYVPYQKLKFCSNVLEGGGNVIEVSGKIPVLIGKGDPPLVWISVNNGDEVNCVVEASNPNSSSVTVANIFGGIVVMYKGVVLLSARQITEEEAEVSAIDLRPIGLNIYGDKNGLQVGNMKLSENHFNGAGTMVSIG